MSDRILVLHEGRDHRRDRRATDATEERVMFAATGSVDGRPGGGRRCTDG